MPLLYGISNCDTVKRARAWLDAQGIAHTFHDYKKAGVPEQHLNAWIDALGWEQLVNRTGTTWRKLNDVDRAGVVDMASARRLMLEQPSIIKRPVVEWDAGAVTVGFDAGDWQRRVR